MSVSRAGCGPETRVSRRTTPACQGLAVVKLIVGALLTWGLIACVAALVVSAIMWALASKQGNYQYASSGKTGVLIAGGAAILIGGANAIITFASGLGGLI